MLKHFGDIKMDITRQIMKKAITHPNRALKVIFRQTEQTLLWNYYYSKLREPKVKSSEKLVPTEKVTYNLKKSALNTVDFNIDVADFKQYLQEAQYSRFPNYYNGGKAEKFVEKALEHYVSTKLLGITKEDVYIDIASFGAPTAEIAHDLYGCESYRQDLVFPSGIHGNTIGGDACKMPLDDGFASKMALHCSFEHFQEDADMKFIKEANRILRKGGKLCIAPLYLADKYLIMTYPSYLPHKKIMFDSDAELYCTKDYKQRHGRFYDVEHLLARVVESSDMKLTIYILKNQKDVDSICYMKYIALFEKEK
jgi:hypothetical protein